MIRPKDIATAFDLPPEKAVAYLKQKGYQITWNWSEMLDRAHRQAFTVAKAMQADILQDIRNGVQSALGNGDSLQTFKKNLRPLLKSKGWWGKVDQTNPSTGAVQSVQAGSPWRLETIYRTNVQSAYQAGRYQEQQAAAAQRPFWQYISVSDNRSRPSHGNLNGLVLPADHAFWSTSYPPNGFRCRCRVTTFTKKGLERAGLKVHKGKVNFAADKGFAAAPTETWKPDPKSYDKAIGKQLQLAFDEELASRPVAKPKVAAKTGEEEFPTFIDSLIGLDRFSKPRQKLFRDSADVLATIVRPQRSVTLALKFGDLAEGIRRGKGDLGAMNAGSLDARLWVGTDFFGVKRSQPEMRATFYHEYGHVVDLGGNKSLTHDRKYQRKHRVDYEQLSRVFSETQAFKNQAPWDLRYRAYLRSPHEVFARGFAQYVAEKADRAAYKDMLSGTAIAHGVQWGESDFAPIREFIEQELKRLELFVD